MVFFFFDEIAAANRAGSLGAKLRTAAVLDLPIVDPRALLSARLVDMWLTSPTWPVHLASSRSHATDRECLIIHQSSILALSIQLPIKGDLRAERSQIERAFSLLADRTCTNS